MVLVELVNFQSYLPNLYNQYTKAYKLGNI